MKVVTLLLTLAVSGPQSAPVEQVEATRPEIRKSFVIPAVEIVLLDAAINAVGRRLYTDGSFDVTPASVRRNLRGPWVVDDDPFQVNQVGHPYQGAMYHGAARSAGLNYWQSAAYTFAGSALWEVAGETTPPSINDQVASGIAGSFLGEALFRTANLLIDKSGGDVGVGRGLLVLLLSPPTGVNRAVFGDRFDGVFPTRDPAYDVRVHVGAETPLQWISGPGAGRRYDAVIDLFMEYGLPARMGYAYDRPFDLFSLQVTATSANLQSLATRGVLAGHRYGAGKDGGGVWGVFGSFDYFAPRIFTVSSTAVSFGTTVQAWASHAMAVQATGTVGVGYVAAQTVNGLSDKYYRYGLAPQALASLRVVGGDRVSIDLNARPFLVSNVAGFDRRGRDLILLGDASVGLRLYRRNALTVRYQLSRRTTSLPPSPAAVQHRETLAVFYTLVGPQRFGAVKKISQ
jgi:hypothetical protein